MRHFPDGLADATFADNMPESVYRTLVFEANKNPPVLHRYLKLGQVQSGHDQTRSETPNPPEQSLGQRDGPHC